VAQPGEQCSVGWPQRRARHLAPEHGHFVTEHDDFNGQLFVFAVAESE
jgi:hypothetical protein